MEVRGLQIEDFNRMIEFLKNELPEDIKIMTIEDFIERPETDDYQFTISFSDDYGVWDACIDNEGVTLSFSEMNLTYNEDTYFSQWSYHICKSFMLITKFIN
jgi:hypothetical protein